MQVEIITPPVDDDAICDGLVSLTAAIEAYGIEIAHGFLGGSHGYGGDFENEIFLMHPFCWCEGDDCPWCSGCSCVIESEQYVDGARVQCWYTETQGDVPPMPSDVAIYGTPEYEKAGKEFDEAIKKRNARIKIVHPEVRHSCQNAWTIDMPRREEFGPPQNAPNFWHKQSGVRVWWYKYIGRSMEIYSPNGVDIPLVIEESINSLGDAH